MRKIIMFAAGLHLALAVFPAGVRARGPDDLSPPGPRSASDYLLQMIRKKPLVMACADAGARCEKDSDCCPGSFCAGADTGAPKCVKI
jgi:hypothetical protein